MNWKLIAALSLFGLAMAFATVSLVTLKLEPILWLIIFIVCGYVIAKNCRSKYFLHGFLVSLLNSIWITVVHIAFFNTYIATHPEMMQMNHDMPLSEHPRLMMAITGPLFGAVSGVVLGLFAFLAAKFVVGKNHIVTKN